MQGNIFRKPTFYLSIFLMLITFTCIFAGTTFAKYITAKSDQDQATVAVFDVAINDKTTAILDEITVSPNKDYTYTFVVTSTNTQVAVRHLIEVDSTNNLPLIFTISHDTTTITMPTNELVNTGEYSTGSNRVEYTLTISWDNNNISSDLANEIDLVKLVISVEQID